MKTISKKDCQGKNNGGVKRKINKRIISLAGTTLLTMGSYAFIPFQVHAVENYEQVSTETIEKITTTNPLTVNSENNPTYDSTEETTDSEGKLSDTIVSENDDGKEVVDSSMSGEIDTSEPDNSQLNNSNNQNEETQESAEVTIESSSETQQNSEENTEEISDIKESSQQNPTADGWGYNVSNGVAVIDSYTGNQLNIVVPSEIAGLPVQIDLKESLGQYLMYTQNFTIENAKEDLAPVTLTGSFRKLFDDNERVLSIDFGDADSSAITDMYSAFSGCKNLSYINISNLDTSNVTTMGFMFSRSWRLKNIDLSNFNTSKVTSMYSMFNHCSALTSLDVSNFDTTNVTTMNEMFASCYYLTNLDLSGFDTTNVTDMNSMLRWSDRLVNLRLSSKFDFKLQSILPNLPYNTEDTSYYWVQDDYKEIYSTVGEFIIAHNKLVPENFEVHTYTMQKKFKVDFDLNGGTGTVPDIQYIFEGQQVIDPNYNGTKEHYTFDKWVWSEDSSVSLVDPITEPGTFVANWTALQYSVRFDSNNGSGEMIDQLISFDSPTSLSENTYLRDAYTFSGWNTMADGSGMYYGDQEEVLNLANNDGEVVTLYAQWRPISFLISFDSNGGDFLDVISYTIEDEVILPTPIRDGYIFTGWYNGSEKIDTIEKGTTGDLYLTASWKRELGWFEDNGVWYYNTENGLYNKGWLLDSNTWYYLAEDGRMQTGWLYEGNSWYYLNFSGKMQTGWVYVEGSWYYLNSSGKMLTGWMLVNNTWYYANPTGRIQIGWVLLGNTWYYTDSSGAMKTKWQFINNHWYYFYADGSMAKNTVIDGYQLNNNGTY